MLSAERDSDQPQGQPWSPSLGLSTLHTDFLDPSVPPSYRLEPDHQHPWQGCSSCTSARWPEDIYPKVAPTGDKQRRCPEDTWVGKILSEKSRVSPGEQAQKRKVHPYISETVLLSAAERPPCRSIYDEKIKGILPWKPFLISFLSTQVMGTLGTCQEEKHSDWGHKSCISKKSSPSPLSGQSSLKHHYFQQPYKNSAKR